MNKDLYFFGIGAQKAGTTWLNDLLETYPECAVPPIKEIHFFNNKYLPRGEVGTRSVYRNRVRGFAGMAGRLGRDIKDHWRSAQGKGKPGGPGVDIYQSGYLSISFRQVFEILSKLPGTDRQVKRYGMQGKMRGTDAYGSSVFKICKEW